jgi:hypothetical protein
MAGAMGPPDSLAPTHAPNNKPRYKDCRMFGFFVGFPSIQFLCNHSTFHPFDILLLLSYAAL